MAMDSPKIAAARGDQERDENLDPGLLDPAALSTCEDAFRDAVAAHLRKLAPRWS